MSEVTSYKAAVILAEERGTGGSTGTAEAGAVLRVRRGETCTSLHIKHLHRNMEERDDATWVNFFINTVWDELGLNRLAATLMMKMYWNIKGGPFSFLSQWNLFSCNGFYDLCILHSRYYSDAQNLNVFSLNLFIFFLYHIFIPLGYYDFYISWQETSGKCDMFQMCGKIWWHTLLLLKCVLSKSSGFIN